MNRFFLFVFIFLSVGCSSDEDIISELEILVDNENVDEINKKPSNAIEIGRLNAVRKAYQMTDLVFTPLLPIEGNYRSYLQGEAYKGLIYSSVKEIGTYVGSNVSFHTFMTAIHNPRSKIYTDIINKPPYHGKNCKAYYGTVCSGLVSYALDLSYGSYDFPVSDLMEEVDYNKLDSLHVADVLWKSGHVALITNVCRNSEGHVKEIEISEARQSGCRRATVSATKFSSMMNSEYKNIYRYKHIDKNSKYTSVPQFVAVLDEVPSFFYYNDDLCPNKGDCSCYREDEEVIINIMHEYDYLEIFKNDEFYCKIDSTTNRDIVLQNLTFGDYKARICYGDNHSLSEFTYWKVVNMEITCDRVSGRLYFSSSNAVPFKMSFSDITGSRKYPHTQLFHCILSDKDRSNGYIEIPIELTKEDRPYIHFYFSTDFGIIQHAPINWFE